MQRGDVNEALRQQHAASGGGDAATATTATPAAQQNVGVSPGTLPQTQYALATQLQALAGQSSPATIGLVHSVRGPVTAAFTLTAQAAPSTGAHPQTVTVSQAAQRLLSPVQSLVSAATPTYQARTINVLQRQLSGQSIVGLSAVPTQGLPQNLTASLTQPGIAVVTTTQSSDPRQVQRSVSFTPVSTVSASGGTIHHHGQSPTRGAPLVSNLPHNIISMNVNQAAQIVQRRSSQGAASSNTGTPVTGRVVLDTRQLLSHPLSHITSTVTRHVQSTGQPPKKKAKLEERPPATPEIAQQRKMILDAKYKEMLEIKENYVEHLTELFFLQHGRNLMDYLAWKKRPTPQLVAFLKAGALDSDEEEEHLQEKRINDEVKVLTSAGSNVPLATPVAISTTLPPSVSALSQQGIKVFADPSSQNTNMNPGSLDNFNIQDFLRQLTAYAKGSESKLGQGRQPSTLLPRTQCAAQPSLAATPGSAILGSLGGNTAVTTATPHSGTSAVLSSTCVASSQLQMQLTKSIPEKQLHIQTTQAIKTPITSAGHTVAAPARLPKSPTSPRLQTRQQSISAVYDSTIGSQEAIVERAKQEAQVVQRVTELRKDGMWTARRLPKVQEPQRNKAHWDYLLEEMTWLAADFIQERKWKKAAARKIARMVQKYHQDQEQKEIKAEKEEALKLKKIAGQMAKSVKEFWSNIEKVVQYKQQSRLEEKRRKALDMHLNFIVDQTEKYSTWLTEGLHTASSAAGSSVATSPEHSSEGGDVEFEPQGTASDDEETIEKEENEAGIDEEAEMKELEELQKESELPLEELIKSLPQEVLEKPASIQDETETPQKSKESKGSDEEFTASEDEGDLEETIEEQEKHEKKKDYKRELDDLEAEGEMSMEELVNKYAGAYDSDFDVPEESSEGETSEDDSDDDIEAQSDEDETTEEEEEEEETEEEGESSQPQEDTGLEFLLKPQGEAEKSPVKQTDTETGPGKEITDIAAEAQSLQPKGYTLETTEVRTPVPFLLKHTLREYQHVGLDWLATMHEKKLNGILADEMGLGKTIQTIAVLAHLACEKGVWGPHLIVVPTSVMLNWEMEFKKWCPAFKILTYYGSQKERKQKRTGWTKTNAFHVCITSYKLVVQDHSAFRRKKWKYFILDEAQNIKNFKSQRWQMLLNFSSQRRLLLTGTPLQNSLMELWSLMHFLMPHVFQSHKEFKEWFSNPLTGMVEGSQEYNDSLVKRLHKVLRPFLLRRLKDDVEKQMPKKYEHVVMCRLSKRQRFLYDEFMSQTKTKETLSQGHFMSVINVLMQLRKVCNHPNLFDPRPIISPFQMRGIAYTTSSLAARALEYDPFKDVDLRSLYPSLAEMELDLPAFIAHRVKKLQTPRRLIVEIDDQPDPPPRLKPGKLKPLTFRSVSPATPQSGRSSPLVPISQARSASPVQLVRTVVRSSTPSQILHPTPVQTSQGAVPIKLGIVSQAQSPATTTATAPVVVQSLAVSQPQSQPTTQTVTVVSSAGVTSASAVPMQATIQAKVVPQQLLQGVFHSSSSSVIPSQPITVQIQQTEQGTRLMIPTGQLSQLPAGLIQIVQTSSGQQLIATSSPAAPIQPVIPVQNVVSTASSSTSSSTAAATATTSTTSSSIVNGRSPALNVASSLTASSPMSANTTVTPTVTQVKSVPAVQLPSGSILSAQKPIMRVTPMAVSSEGMPFTIRAITPVTTITSSTTSTATVTKVVPSTNVRPSATVAQVSVVASKPSDSIAPVVVTTRSVPADDQRERRLKAERAEEKSELFLRSLRVKKHERRKNKLEYISNMNKKHCEMKPVYGQDLCEAVDVTQSLSRTRVVDNLWHGLGYVQCLCAHHCQNPDHPDFYWQQSDIFKQLIHTPEQYLQELRDILSRYLFVTPTVVAPTIKMHVSHPCPSAEQAKKRMSFMLHQEVSPQTACLHSLSTKMMVQFPELRLIEYDCGKLQTLDILLHRLKSGSHRVLIFTQMTKMLDVLEAFLSYHGHRYLRLDGTTKVEQRQALMDRFNMDRRIFCFILSTRSGGIGVNLTGADTVIFYDSDWNPTMDAQAQDRCHRIGQTRDVHIYRLISERTIEENILKKANQKRLLGDLAIEGGNFTTAFFKEHTIKELFEEPSGLDALAKEKQAQAAMKQGKELHKEPPKKLPEGETNVLAQFEQALCKAEDETDAIAVKLVKAEQKAELAEFDETIPWDEKEAESKKDDEVSKVELELAQLDKELTPIERYAVGVMEAEMEPETIEELMIAEEDIENSKKEWELARLKALKEEEERRLELEEDEMLYTYSRDDAYNQVYVSDLGPETMPMWAPPTPPKDDNDVYIDQTMYFLYEPAVMTETQLPPVYVRKEHKKPRIETVTTRKQKQRKEEQPRVPRSLFDRPTAALLKMRREAKLQKLKQGLIKPYRPAAPAVPSKPVLDTAPDHPEWLIHEDWALLQAVQTLLSLPLNLMVVAPAHIPNWDLVADVVNSCSRVYRSPKQCRSRYENVIIPREEGRILYDISPRKQKKTKGIYKTKNNRPMRTSQLYIQDSNNSVTMLYSLRFDSVKGIAGKRPPTLRQTLVNPTMKNPKHAAVLQESGIIYDTPLTPLQVAANRADRIAREKKQSQVAAAAAAAEQQLAAQRTQQAQQQQQQQQQAGTVVQGTSTTSTPVVPAAIQASHLQPLVSVATASTNVIQAGAVQKMPVGQTVSIPRTLSAGNIVVNTPAGMTSTFAAINKRMSQANSTIAVTGNLTQAVRARAPVAVHEITTVTTQPGQVAAGVPTATATLRTATASTNLAHAQLATQRILTGTTVPGKATTVQQQLNQSALKNFSQQQINILRQQPSIVRPQNPQQTIRTQKLSITTDQMRQQINKRPNALVGQQKLISTPQAALLTSVATKQGILKQPTMKLTDEQMLAIRRTKTQQGTAGAQAGQSQLQLQVTQPQVRQIIQAQVQQVANQTATSQTPVATLVKSVSAPAGTIPSVTIPVSINVSVGQHKAGVAQRATVSQLQQQQQQQKMYLTQQRKTPQGQKVTTLGQAQVGKTQQIPLIIPQQKGGLPFTGQLLHQIVKQQQQQGQGATIQQIITHASQQQPTIIATVTQGQGTQPLVAKASVGTPTAHIQTLSAASPITVTQVTSATGQHAPITLNVATPVSQATVVKALTGEHATVQVQQAASQPKITTITQSLVSQQLQQVSTAQIHQIQASALQTSAAASQPATIQVHSPMVTPQASPSSVPTQVTPTIPQAATIATVVTQPQQPGVAAVGQAAQAKPSPYAMRTRTRN